MSLLRIATANILEDATTVTDTGTPTAGYPITRLFDRNTAREYRITEDVARETIVTGGIDAVSVNAFMLAAGHNVGGLTHTLAKSANGTDYTTIDTGALPAGTGVVCVEFAATSAVYWRHTLPTNQDVALTEMLLTNIYAFTRAPSRPSGALETEYNVRPEETSAGSERFIEYGPARRVRNYSFPNIAAADVTEITGRINALGMTKPFFLCDHAGVWIWGNLTEPLAPAEIAAGRFSMEFRFREVLG